MRLRRAALGLALLAVLLLLSAGPGARLGLWPFTVGILALGVAGLIGLAAMVLAAVGLSRPSFRRAGRIGLVLALGLGALAAAVPIAGYVKGRSVPLI
jgi:hypothetical protein